MSAVTGARTPDLDLGKVAFCHIELPPQELGREGSNLQKSRVRAGRVYQFPNIPMEASEGIAPSSTGLQPVTIPALPRGRGPHPWNRTTLHRVIGAAPSTR